MQDHTTDVDRPAAGLRARLEESRQNITRRRLRDAIDRLREEGKEWAPPKRERFEQFADTGERLLAEGLLELAADFIAKADVALAEFGRARRVIRTATRMYLQRPARRVVPAPVLRIRGARPRRRREQRSRSRSPQPAAGDEPPEHPCRRRGRR